MSLLDDLDTPAPAVGELFHLHPDLYDTTDRSGHPVMVVAVDEVRQRAEVATRTTKPHAKGPHGVPHRADPHLGLHEFGWWRIDYTKSVPFANFEDCDDARYVGAIDDTTYERLLRLMGQRSFARAPAPRRSPGSGATAPGSPGSAGGDGEEDPT